MGDVRIIAAVQWVPKGKITGRPVTAVGRLEDEGASMVDQQGGGPSAANGGVEGRGSREANPKKAAGDDRAWMDNDDDTTDATHSSAHPPKDPNDPFNLAEYDDDEAMNDASGAKFAGKHLFNVLERDAAIATADAHLQEADSDVDALDIRPSDFVLLSVNAKSDVSSIDVCVYDEENEAFYTHHDIMLSDMPSCSEWVTASPEAQSGEGRYCAVGLMNSLIEIWDVNVIDVLEPAVTLGGSPIGLTSGGLRTKQQRTSRPAATDSDSDGHVDAVIGLHANTHRIQLLASGSADKSCRIWDLSAAKALYRYDHHSAEVQNVRWHPSEQSVLMTASYDHSICVLDVREPGLPGRINLPGEKRLPVAAVWNPQIPSMGLVSSSTGHVSAFDIRRLSSTTGALGQDNDKQSALLWDLHAHSRDCSVSMCGVSNLLMTASEDGTAKVWKLNVSTEESSPLSGSSLPSLQFERDLKGGPLLGVQAHPDAPSLFAFAGTEIVLWDLSDTPHLVEIFSLTEQG